MAVALKIEMEDIPSSNLARIGFDPKRNILAVQFRGGGIYHYAGVSLDVALGLGRAESKGRFYHQHIRGKFQAERMDGRCPRCGDEHGWIGDRCDDCGTADYVPYPYTPKEQRDGKEDDRGQTQASEGSAGDASTGRRVE